MKDRHRNRTNLRMATAIKTSLLGTAILIQSQAREAWAFDTSPDTTIVTLFGFSITVVHCLFFWLAVVLCVLFLPELLQVAGARFMGQKKPTEKGLALARWIEQDEKWSRLFTVDEKRRSVSRKQLTANEIMNALPTPTNKGGETRS